MPGMSDPASPFDSRLARLRRDRWLAASAFPTFLHEEVADRLIDRLADIRRRFARVLDLGSGPGTLARRLQALPSVDLVVRLDPARRAAARATGPFVAASEDLLPFAAGSFDATLSALCLHRVNDLPGALVQLRDMLSPDGLFLAGFPGGQTLAELRHALTLAELEIRGGASPRVLPFVDLADAAALLQRAGFALPVADIDRITVRYADPLRLIDDLRRMGESNVLRAGAREPLSRSVLGRALEIYAENFAAPEGGVYATFEIVWLTGWRPDASQPRPLPRGSASVDLAELLGRGTRSG